MWDIFAIEKNGYYGRYGGAYIPEILHTTIEELKSAFDQARRDPEFWHAYETLMGSYSCRPTPITHLENISRDLGGAQIYLKREDLNQTGAHKANNVFGQGLLMQRMGKNRVIAETGAGQHGVASATMAARMGFKCTIYMGADDVRRQRPNVFWMQQLGAEVITVEDGTRTLKDAINAAMRDWVGSMDHSHYVLGTACGPHPYPQMVSYFQSIIGKEARKQWETMFPGEQPTAVIACVGGGSNAMGLFQGFLDCDACKIIGAEAGGRGLEGHAHAARLAQHRGTEGIAHGYRTYFLQDEDGQMRDTHSVAAGLDYVGVSPILSYLSDIGRLQSEAPTDVEVIAALKKTIQREGIIPALESSHALAAAYRLAPTLPTSARLLVSLSGRGDKDIFTIADALHDPAWEDFITETAERYKKKR